MEWQPIVSAPRDEEQIIWWGGPGTRQFAVVWYPTYKECFEAEGSMWMPIPPTPQEP
jgi:hypothetical protein